MWSDVRPPPKVPLDPVPHRVDHEAREGYSPVVQPVDNSTNGTIVGETHYSPAEGTA
jgi:hypothetical protein